MAKRKRTTRKVDARLVRDRVAFLQYNAVKVRSFPTRQAALDFAVEQQLETGLDYSVAKRGRTARLQAIDSESVRASSEMVRIRNDLREGSRRVGGRKARALEALGRRENFFDWPVGETPS